MVSFFSAFQRLVITEVALGYVTEYRRNGSDGFRVAGLKKQTSRVVTVSSIT